MPHHSKQQGPRAAVPPLPLPPLQQQSMIVSGGGSFPPGMASGSSAASTSSPKPSHYFRREYMMPPPGISASMSMPPLGGGGGGGRGGNGTNSNSTNSSPGVNNHNSDVGQLQQRHHASLWMTTSSSSSQFPPQPYQSHHHFQQHQHQHQQQQQQQLLQQQDIYRMPITPMQENTEFAGGKHQHPLQHGAHHRLHQTNSVSSSSREGSPPMMMMMNHHERTKSFDSQHEIAASVLMLASSIRDAEQHQKHQQQQQQQHSDVGSCDVDDSDDNGSSAVCKNTNSNNNNNNATNTDNNSTCSTSSNRPLKKRKNCKDILQHVTTTTIQHHQHQDEEQHACHVSPMSGKSSPEHVMNGGSVTGAVTEGSHATTPNSSYEVRDEHSSKKAIEQTPPQQPPPPHSHILLTNTTTSKIPSKHNGAGDSDAVHDFPVLLHAVLSESEFADNVIKWLPDGKSFKIVRWDALRRQVLPKYFPMMSSIDAFLWQIQIWGFTEITDGPDAGAYTHMFFRSGHRDLCSQMVPKVPTEGTNDPDDPEQSTVVPMKDAKAWGGDHSRSILRVPSLASTSGSIETSRITNHGGIMECSSSSDRIGGRKMDYNNIALPSYDNVTGHYHPAWGYGNSIVPTSSRIGDTGGPISVNYRPEEAVNVLDHHLQQQQHSVHQLHWSYSMPHSTKHVNWIHSNGSNGGGNTGGHALHTIPTVAPHSPQQSSTTSSSHVVTTRGMPPYSPIRIRSSRGAHRLVVTSSSSSSGRRSPLLSKAEQNGNSTSFTPIPPARAFPVSNRGMGRRSLAPPSLHRIIPNDQGAGSDEIEMLKNLQTTTIGVSPGSGPVSVEVVGTATKSIAAALVEMSSNEDIPVQIEHGVKTAEGTTTQTKSPLTMLVPPSTPSLDCSTAILPSVLKRKLSHSMSPTNDEKKVDKE